MFASILPNALSKAFLTVANAVPPMVSAFAGLLYDGDDPYDPCGGFADALNNPVWKCVTAPLFIVLGILITLLIIRVGWKQFMGEKSTLKEADGWAKAMAIIGDIVVLLFGIFVMIQPLGGFFGITWGFQVLSWFAVQFGAPPMCGS